MRSAWYAHVDKSGSAAEGLRRSIPNILPYGLGVSGVGKTAIGFGEPAGYAGAVLLPFAAVGLFVRRRERWPLLLFGLLGLALWARFPGVTDVVASLPLFDIGLNERLVFLAAFAVSALAALGAERIREGGRIRTFAAAVLVSAAAIVALFREVRPTLSRLAVEDAYLRGRLLCSSSLSSSCARSAFVLSRLRRCEQAGLARARCRAPPPPLHGPRGRPRLRDVPEPHLLSPPPASPVFARRAVAFYALAVSSFPTSGAVQRERRARYEL